MKKIMFNDKFLLTQAVLNGTKTMTRRIADVPTESIFKTFIDNHGSKTYAVGFDEKTLFEWKMRYQIGEVVAIAQPYKDIIECMAEYSDIIINVDGSINREYKAGWTNKMFVKANLMPHHIRITDARIERLQDITEEDCLKEGVWQFYDDKNLFYISKNIGYAPDVAFLSAREAFWYLIDSISGKGTLERNPWVEAYTFEKVD